MGEDIEANGDKWQYGWLVGGTDSPCNGVKVTKSGVNPCGYKFKLDDGVTYHWEGCGGGTWMMWESGTKSGNLGDCKFVQEITSCKNVTTSSLFNVTGNYLCG